MYGSLNSSENTVYNTNSYNIKKQLLTKEVLLDVKNPDSSHKLNLCKGLFLNKLLS